MTDASHYQSSLAGDAPPIHPDDIKIGYYKVRKFKGAPWSPVCIWRENGELVCRVGNEMADPAEIWLRCANAPVSKADALHAFEHNRWPGDAPPPIGDNQAPSDDPFDAITRELQAEEARVNIWIAEPHEGKTAADLSANWLAALRLLETKTVTAFDAEKAPALAETKRIDGKWRNAKDLAAALKKAMSDRYGAIARKEQRRLQDIADAKAKEEAERKRQEWEAEQAKLAALAQEHNIAVEVEATPTFAPIAEPVKVAFGGAQGSRIGIRKTPPKALVENWSMVAVHFAGNAKLREVLQKLADHAVKDGHAVPGVKTIPGE